MPSSAAPSESPSRAFVCIPGSRISAIFRPRPHAQPRGTRLERARREAAPARGQRCRTANRGQRGRGDPGTGRGRAASPGWCRCTPGPDRTPPLHAARAARSRGSQSRSWQRQPRSPRRALRDRDPNPWPRGRRVPGRQAALCNGRAPPLASAVRGARRGGGSGARAVPAPGPSSSSSSFLSRAAAAAGPRGASRALGRAAQPASRTGEQRRGSGAGGSGLRRAKGSGPGPGERGWPGQARPGSGARSSAAASVRPPFRGRFPPAGHVVGLRPPLPRRARPRAAAAPGLCAPQAGPGCPWRSGRRSPCPPGGEAAVLGLLCAPGSDSRNGWRCPALALGTPLGFCLLTGRWPRVRQSCAAGFSLASRQCPCCCCDLAAKILLGFGSRFFSVCSVPYVLARSLFGDSRLVCWTLWGCAW